MPIPWRWTSRGGIGVGHLNYGFSVYNGTSWRNDDVPHGPIGERICKIALCPVDGMCGSARARG